MGKKLEIAVCNVQKIEKNTKKAHAMVNNTAIFINLLKNFSDNGIIPEEEFSNTILIIKYSKQKKFNFDELTWFPHCPTEKKNGK